MHYNNFKENRKLFFYDKNLENDKENYIRLNILNGIIAYIKKTDYNLFINKISGKASNEELRFAIAMELQGIPYEYNSLTLPLLPPFTTKYKSYLKTVYTPDFTIKVGKRTILIEIKGYITTERNFQYKLYDFMISQKYPKYEYCVLKWAGTTQAKDQELYLYSQNVSRGAIDKGNRTKNNFYTWLKVKKKEGAY